MNYDSKLFKQFTTNFKLYITYFVGWLIDWFFIIYFYYFLFNVLLYWTYLVPKPKPKPPPKPRAVHHGTVHVEQTNPSRVAPWASEIGESNIVKQLTKCLKDRAQTKRETAEFQDNSFEENTSSLNSREMRKEIPKENHREMNRKPAVLPTMPISQPNTSAQKVLYLLQYCDIIQYSRQY